MRGLVLLALVALTWTAYVHPRGLGAAMVYGVVAVALFVVVGVLFTPNDR